jgi:hypothetical protein
VRAVALPHEHGGWGLTLEPVLLGLLVAPSAAGVALGAAAVAAFLVRAPLKVVGVDCWRHRRLPRTTLAAQVAAIELAVLAALVMVTVRGAGPGWWAPLAVAAPLVAVEAAYDVRSRSRRLVPELCGAIGIASVAAAIARAGEASWTISIGLWLVLAARAVASVPFARAQVLRAKGRRIGTASVDLAQVAAVAIAAAGWVAGAVPGAAFVAVAAVALGQTAWLRLRPPPVVVVGVTQLAVGLAIVGVTAAAIRLG